MRALSSLRWKIALTTTMVCCMVALALGILVHNVVARQMVGEVRKAAATELDHALGHYEYGTAHGDVNAVFDPPDLPRRLRELVASGQTGSIVGVQGGKPVMWAAGPADGKALAVWLPFGSTRERLRDIDTAILASAILAAGLVALAGLFLADRISRRLATTAAVARRITAGDLDARVNFPHEGTMRARAAPATRYGTWRTRWTRWRARSRAGWRRRSASRRTSRTSCAPRSPVRWPRRRCCPRAAPRR